MNGALKLPGSHLLKLNRNEWQFQYIHPNHQSRTFWWKNILGLLFARCLTHTKPSESCSFWDPGLMFILSFLVYFFSLVSLPCIQGYTVTKEESFDNISCDMLSLWHAARALIFSLSQWAKMMPCFQPALIGNLQMWYKILVQIIQACCSTPSAYS